MEFGQQLRRVRIKAGLTQQDIADALFISRSDVSKIENNKKGLPAEYLLKWCKLTNSPDLLMTLYYATEVINMTTQYITGTVLGVFV